MARVVSSRNLFVDTSDIGGDNAEINLAHDHVRAFDGQGIRLTLQSFTMYRNFYSVDHNNNRVVLEDLSGVSHNINITPGNYETYGEIVLDFAKKVAQILEIEARTRLNNQTVEVTVHDPNVASAASDTVLPPITETVTSSGTRVLGFRLSFSSAFSSYGNGQIKLRCLASDGESAELLGVDTTTTTGPSSFMMMTDGSSDITVFGHYPMQRSTYPEIYLRTNLASDNIESSTLAGGNNLNHTVSSNILAVMQTDHEFVHYDNTNDQWQYQLRTKELNHLKLFLTDRKNRPLGRARGSSWGTAAGSVGNQSTTGNLSFCCVLRIDVLQMTVPHYLEVKEPEKENPKLGGVYNMTAYKRHIC